MTLGMMCAQFMKFYLFSQVIELMSRARLKLLSIEWQCQGPDSFDPNRGLGRDIGGKMDEHGFDF